MNEGDADVGIIDVEGSVGPVRDESHSNCIDYSSKDKDSNEIEGRLH
jgi:hypothetical protein